MKKIILFFLLFLLSAATFCQQTTTATPLTKTDYLQKSKHQKTTAVILTLACPVLILSPALIGANTGFSAVLSYSFTALGILCLPASIPFFIASHRNKKKSMSLSFDYQKLPKLQYGHFASHTIPSLKLKINL